MEKTICLSGDDWRIWPDATNDGEGPAWDRQIPADALPARVPGSIQETLPGYHGVAWYWKRFPGAGAPPEGGKALLRFHAVNYRCQVWLNSRPVGKHEGARPRSSSTSPPAFVPRARTS